MGVLVTRPGEQGTMLTDMLNKAGIASLHLPFFRIEAGTELNQLPAKLAWLNPGDYVVSVSRNSAEYAAQTLNATGFRWRSDLRYFAVGLRSAEVLAALAAQPVVYPWRSENSEGLLALDAMSAAQLAGRRVLLLRGNGGRALFPETVCQRGAELDIVECYQRQTLDYDNHEQTSMCIRAGITTIVVSSAEILTHLIDFVPKNDHNWLKSCQLITVSDRIARLAYAAGWHKVAVAQRAENSALFHAVLASQES